MSTQNSAEEQFAADKLIIDKVAGRNNSVGKIVQLLLLGLGCSILCLMLLVAAVLDPSTRKLILGSLFAGIFLLFSWACFSGAALRSYTLHLHRCGGERRIGFLPRGKPWICQHCAPSGQIVLQLPVGGLQSRRGRWVGPASFSDAGWMICTWRLALVGQGVVSEANERLCAFFVRATASGESTYYRGDRGARVLRDRELFQLIDSSDWRSSAVYSDVSDWIRGLENRVESECARAVDNLKRVRRDLDASNKALAEVKGAHRLAETLIELNLRNLARVIATIDGESRLRNTAGARKVVHHLLCAYKDCAPAGDQLRRRVDVVLEKLADNPSLDVFALLPVSMKHQPDSREPHPVR